MVRMRSGAHFRMCAGDTNEVADAIVTVVKPLTVLVEGQPRFTVQFDGDTVTVELNGEIFPVDRPERFGKIPGGRISWETWMKNFCGATAPKRRM